MTEVKVCGITGYDQGVMVSELMPDYAGLVFAPGRRQLSIEQAEGIATSLHPTIKRVGVFVNQDRVFILDCIKRCRLDIIQLHGDEEVEHTMGYSCPVWKAFRVKDADSLQKVYDYPVDGYLLDAYTEGSYGGSGSCFDWPLAGMVKRCGRLILAGGLTAVNILGAMDIVKPDVVDVSSGVETKGMKDYAKIKEFIQAVRGVNYE